MSSQSPESAILQAPLLTVLRRVLPLLAPYRRRESTCPRSWISRP